MESQPFEIHWWLEKMILSTPEDLQPCCFISADHRTAMWWLPREGANRESHLSRPPHRKPESFALQGWFQKKKNLHATRMRTRTSDIRCCVHAHIHLAIFMASGHALRNYWDKHRWSLAWPTYVSQATLQRLLKYSLLVWRRILFLIVNMWSLFWGLDFSVL